MINKSIKKILERKHFWRDIEFDELAELYTSQFLRSLSISLVGIFVPIYLYNIGYSLQDILFMQVIWAGFRPLASVIAAKTIASLGPKHAMAIGTIVQIAYLGVLMTIETYGWQLWLLGVLGSVAYALFIIGLEVNFSKIKHTEHGGKELGYIMIFERIGAALGPFVGGLIASFINPQLTVFIASLLMAISLIPLFLSAESVRINQKLVIKGFPWRRHKRDFLVAPFIGIENVISIIAWPLFISLTIFQNNTYAAIGLLTSVGMAISLFAIYLFGHLIDKSKGLALLNGGAIINAVLHIARFFVNTPLGALFISFTNEPVTASYRMPLSKGLYDAADSVPGYRIIYLTLFDTFRMIGLFIFWLSVYVSSLFITNDADVLRFTFIIGALSSLGILLQRFPALKS